MITTEEAHAFQDKAEEIRQKLAIDEAIRRRLVVAEAQGSRGKAETHRVPEEAGNAQLLERLKRIEYLLEDIWERVKGLPWP